MAIGYGSNVHITDNTIVGGLNTLVGILLFASSNASNPTVADVSKNAISNILCAELTDAPAGTCANTLSGQFQMEGILVEPNVYPQTTPNDISITNNYIHNTDNGITIFGSQNCCVVSNNLIKKSTDYALLGIDGNYAFSNNKIIGGPYAVGASANVVNTTVTMIDNVIQGISIAPTYIQATPPFTAKVVFKK
jgi:hypothetical protein